ncbi:DUF2920 family protein [Sediminibacillus dalangtanensis]|uniref:DUF2920 family protein n=1 Tax=Sediminibacillus dalangtanensis TaxID=2729421 RepID=A0ABX7VYF7_9BACI|nr:DUF2920 family protein [Sediminibacillus dalangtanensis]QTN01125.1 DUF2920 family protein [Sediminibacillus dalangtanensis]
MSEQHSINIAAHHNIYTGISNRELRIDFSTPQNGVNHNTGLLIFVPGFGANIDSKVYKKMREVFADTYNMVTIQCNYFGNAFMQSADHFKLKNPQDLQKILTKDELEITAKDSSALLKILAEKNILLPVLADIKENAEEFNDMSYMQAIDIISAIEAVRIILGENDLTFNVNRIIGYGHSHGAYLLHLSNRLVPNMFSFLVDNSAWIEPVYLSSNRVLYQKIGRSTLAIEFDYLAKKMIKNKQNLNLETLYNNFNGKTQILSFQGDEDNLVDYQKKKRVVEGIGNSAFILVKKDDVDNFKYKSNGHGLNADFLELFSFALEFERPRQEAIEREIKHRVDLEYLSVEVDFTHGLPVFDFK